MFESDALLSPLRECPACGSRKLDAVVEIDGETVDFRCSDCKRNWHVELGYVREVHTST